MNLFLNFIVFYSERILSMTLSQEKLHKIACLNSKFSTLSVELFILNENLKTANEVLIPGILLEIKEMENVIEEVKLEIEEILFDLSDYYSLTRIY